MRYKVIAAYFLLVFLLLSACSINEATPEIRFYYCENEYQYNVPSGIIASQGYAPLPTEGHTEVITKYLRGPENGPQKSPFPVGTSLVEINAKDDRAEILLSKEFAQLTKIDLTIACACLTLTVSEVTGCSTVEISAVDSLLNNQRSIIMNSASIFLSDMVTGTSSQ